MPNNKIVCITGLCGSGKSEVADFFVKQNYAYFRFGQITLDEIKKRNSQKDSQENSHKNR